MRMFVKPGVDVKKEFKKQIQREEEDLQQLFTDVRDSVMSMPVYGYRDHDEDDS